MISELTSRRHYCQKFLLPVFDFEMTFIRERASCYLTTNHFLLILQYLCSALGSDYNSKLDARIDQVMDEIEEKGHYDLTNEELTHGARLAWRNAPRCVNRIVWRQLEVRAIYVHVHVFWT